MQQERRGLSISVAGCKQIQRSVKSVVVLWGFPAQSCGRRETCKPSLFLSLCVEEREKRDTAARASFGLQPSQNPRITFASSCFQQHLERARERYGRQQTIGVCVCECVLGERKGRLCAEKSTGELIENFQAFLSLSPHNSSTGVLSHSIY